MPIPDFQAAMFTVLQSLGDGQEHTMRDVTDVVSEEFNLTEDERQEMLPSRQARVIVNRVGWSKKYLQEAGLLETVKRGIVRITDEGKQVLSENPARIDMKFLERFPSYVEFRERTKAKAGKKTTDEPTVVESSQTPEELIEESYSELRDALADEILQQVKELSDKFFERLVVQLLVAMGYGGSIEDAGKAVGRSGDGGIDGVIKEDKLGLDVVVVQAKRWTTNQVGRPDVQSFAGSMEAYRANKGVFITTSTFSQPAKDYVNQIQRKIVLVDGPDLANLMIDHDTGVSAYRAFVLKRLDTDFFEE
jgi:restriction system protein